MDQQGSDGTRLEFARGRPALTDLAEINETLHPVGFRAWPLDLSTAAAAIRDILGRSYAPKWPAVGR